jgi:DHA1 family inner membrane transport protein
MFFSNYDINLLTVHTTLHKLAWGGFGAFFGVFLFRAGIPVAGIFLAFAAIYAARFVLRPLVLFTVPAIGLRRTLIIGTFLHAIQYPALALVHDVGLELVLFCAITAIGWVFYWTCYHAFFGALGDADRRGSQVGVRQAFGAVAAVLGPALGGIMLTFFGPWAAFGAAAVVEIAAIIPLLWIKEPEINRTAPRGAYVAAKTGVLLFITDGWILSSSILAWTIIMFQSLDARFDALGGTLAAAALAGALGGMVLGWFVDLGHARRATWINASVFSGILIAKSVCGNDPAIVVAVAIVTTMFGGLYTPSLMIAFYNEAKASPCPLRFQFAAEGGWDVGACSVSLVAAALCAMNAPLQVMILLALPLVGVQALLLDGSYAARRIESGNAPIKPS